jgi:DNA-binding MarR family transcriptional regulator
MIDPTGSTEKNPADGFDERELRLLEEIYHSPHVTQRGLAQSLAIGLGMTNLLVRRMAAKGYVRATRAGWRSWAYSLTPKGMTRRFRLVRGYVRRVLGDYRSIRESLTQGLSETGMAEGARVAIYYPPQDEDASGRDIAELVYLALKDGGAGQIDVFGGDGSERFLGTPIRPISTLGADLYDWVVVASLDDRGPSLAGLQDAGVLPERILTPLGGSLPTPASKQSKGHRGKKEQRTTSSS